MRVLFVQHQDDCPPGLVGARLAELGARSDVVFARDGGWPDPEGYDLVVPLGADDSAADETLPYLAGERDLLERAIAADVPVFGICFGAQLLCRVLGGTVRTSPSGPEIAWVRSADDGLVGDTEWLFWHADIMEPAEGTAVLARTRAGVAAISRGRHLGVQFHPEATLPSIRAWAAHHRLHLADLATTPAEVLAEAEARATAAPGLAAGLVDRVLVHAGIAARATIG